MYPILSRLEFCSRNPRVYNIVISDKVSNAVLILFMQLNYRFVINYMRDDVVPCSIVQV